MVGGDKLVQERLSLLELAERLGNVSEACRRKKISRARFYEYKRRFQAYGLEGLKNLPPVHESHPLTTPQAVVGKIVELSREHPAWGCSRISGHLALMGFSISSPTIQKILARHGMGTRKERWLKLEGKAQRAETQLTREQVAWLERQNPCFRERHKESSRPGELLCQGTIYVGWLRDVGTVRLQAVVDTYESYAFGWLHVRKARDHAVLLLNNKVLPFYKERGLKVKAILTSGSREYCGNQMHPYEFFLNLAGIEHRTTLGGSSPTNGFIDRFRWTALSEFFHEAFRNKFYTTVETLQTDLDKWLVHYNTKRPHLGYRNMGRRPIDVIEQYLVERQLS